MRYLFFLLSLLSYLHSNPLNFKLMQDEARVAYLIGNGSPQNTQHMQDFLEDFDFDIIIKPAANKRDMLKGLLEFDSKMTSQGISLFYFNGRIVQVRDNNYLIPSTSKIKKEDYIMYDALKLETVLSTLNRSNNRLNIIIIDTTNQDLKSFIPSKVGMSKIEKQDNTIFIFSAQENENSKQYPFTQKLISFLSIQGTSSSQALKAFKYNYPDALVQHSNNEFYFHLQEEDNVENNEMSLPEDNHDNNETFLPKDNNSSNYQKTTQAAKKEELRIIRSNARYVEPHMQLIKAGSFIMGSNTSLTDEYPSHQILIKNDFYIGKYEVTNIEYIEYLKATNQSQKIDKTWKHDTQPVINISWKEATAYASWLSDLTQKSYRLPTEEEWEYVARAGSTGTYYWTPSKESNPDNFAWMRTNSEKISHIVGSKTPNAWGIYDISGNVWEWCSSIYTDNYNTPFEEESLKIMRGGSWFSSLKDLSVSHRGANVDDFRSYNIGFRLLREK